MNNAGRIVLNFAQLYYVPYLTYEVKQTNKQKCTQIPPYAIRHPKQDSCRQEVGSMSAAGTTHGNSKPVLKRCMYATPTAPSVSHKVGSKGN